MWLKTERFMGHKIYFLKKDDGIVRCFIDSKKNYSADGWDKSSAFDEAKHLIRKHRR